MTSSFASYIAGKLPSNLSMSTARRLLDEARSALLLGKSKPAAPSLAQSNEILAMAGQVDAIQKRAEQLEAQGVAQPLLNAFVEIQQGKSAPAPARPPAPVAAVRPSPAAKPPVKSDPFTAVQEQFARARELTKAATARPSPRPAPVAARPAAPAPRPAPAKPLPPPQSSAPKTMPTPATTSTTSTTSTPTASERRLASALLDEQERRDAAALVRTRAQLDAMKPTAIAAFFKNGGKLIS